ncbi:hypothetical protein ACTXT7_013499 [Hymenolepis weldensis]
MTQLHAIKVDVEASDDKGDSSAENANHVLTEIYTEEFYKGENSLLATDKRAVIVIALGVAISHGGKWEVIQLKQSSIHEESDLTE